MVGRQRERERLRGDFDDAVAGRSCRLFTLIGPAGVGKSRLVADFLEQLSGSVTVASGRALSYGEGITYWPLVELLIQAGIDPTEAIRSSPGDTQLATRAHLEAKADEGPLVLVLEDLHWAEPPMLDLVEHIVDWSRGSPIFVLCVARPELLDARPGWGGGKLNATSLLLEPLPPDEAAMLASSLPGASALDDETRTRLLATAEGNPLFIEELSALARDPETRIGLPPTIQAVLQARLDALGESERTMVERGAVEGQVFHRGAVAALGSTVLDDIPEGLLSLVRKEVLRPDRSRIPGDDAFRFRHLLIRDTAYESLPKAVRADLHVRFADWLEAHAHLLEQDEIVGYHLEQAARYRRELDAEDATAAALAQRAAERLGTAGAAAFDRTDLHATRNLLERALALVDEGPLRRSLIPPLVEARLEVGDVEGLTELVGELDRGDERERATAAALRASVDPASGSSRSFASLEADVDAAQPVLERADDWMGAARCERARAMLAWAQCQSTKSHRAMLRCWEYLRRAGSTAWQSDLMTNIPGSAAFAGLPVTEVASIIDELEQDAGDAGPLHTVGLRAARARMESLAGVVSIEEARAVVIEHADLLRQVGSKLEAQVSSGILVVYAFLEGPEEYERVAREHAEGFEALGDRFFLANALGDWAAALCGLGRARDALDAIARGRAIARADDLADAALLDVSEAYARALLRDREHADHLLERANETLRDVEMAYVVHNVGRIEASVRATLGDVGAARLILTRLAEDADRQGLARFAQAYRHQLAALDSSTPD